MTAAASAGRFEGSLESRPRTSRSTSGGTHPGGALELGGRGLSITCAKAASVAGSAANTGLPESSSYIIAPKP